MDERLKFVARLLEGEKMAVLCREFDISRKTGYKIFSRYKASGLEGLTDRSRRPYRQGCQLPFQVEKLILQVKSEHPSWGAPKIREKIRRRFPELRLPAISTVHAVLDRNGLVNVYRPRQSYRAQGTSLSQPMHPNELWCADYKGEFMLADRRYCYPELRITHHAETDAPPPGRSFARLSKPGLYVTTVTRPEMFGDYLAEQMRKGEL